MPYLCALAPPGSSSAPGLNWNLSVLGRPGLVDVSFLPACRGVAALLSARSAVDSSEDTSPSLHIAGHRDPLFCHRCRLVQSDFVNGYLLQSPPNCVTSNPKYRYQPPPGRPACTRHSPRYGYTVIIICVPVLDLSTLPLPHWKLVIPVPWHQNGPCQLVRTLAFHVFQTHAPIVKLQSRQFPCSAVALHGNRHSPVSALIPPGSWHLMASDGSCHHAQLD